MFNINVPIEKKGGNMVSNVNNPYSAHNANPNSQKKVVTNATPNMNTSIWTHNKTPNTKPGTAEPNTYPDEPNMIEDNDPSPTGEGPKEVSLEQLALEEFKRLDLDGNLKVSKQEFIDDVINNYVNIRDNYGQRPSDIAAYIQERAEAFTKHAGDDESMNIDEYNIFKQAGN